MIFEKPTLTWRWSDCRKIASWVKFESSTQRVVVVVVAVVVVVLGIIISSSCGGCVNLGVARDDVAATVRQGGTEGPSAHDQPLPARRGLRPSGGGVTEVQCGGSPARHWRESHAGDWHAGAPAEIPEKDSWPDRSVTSVGVSAFYAHWLHSTTWSSYTDALIVFLRFHYFFQGRNVCPVVLLFYEILLHFMYNLENG